jgi:hypothetical protein
MIKTEKKILFILSKLLRVFAVKFPEVTKHGKEI